MGFDASVISGVVGFTLGDFLLFKGFILIGSRISMLIMALVSLLAVRAASGRRLSGVDPHFFALGAGFLLLETRSLSVLAVLVGSTWGVTTSVFAGVLVMSLAATVMAARLVRCPPRLVLVFFVLLGGLLALNFLLISLPIRCPPLRCRLLLHWTLRLLLSPTLRGISFDISHGSQLLWFAGAGRAEHAAESYCQKYGCHGFKSPHVNCSVQPRLTGMQIDPR